MVPDETLGAAMPAGGEEVGPTCFFCRVIAALMREPFHCRDQMSVNTRG